VGNLVSHFEGGTRRVFKNRELRRIFGPKRKDDGSWRKFHNDELYSLLSPPHTVRVIKSRRMKWAGHVARIEKGEVFTGFWLGGPKRGDHWRDQGLGGRITLRWTAKQKLKSKRKQSLKVM
jgi:hypothetical protein